MSIFNEEKPQPKTNIEFNAVSTGFDCKVLSASLNIPFHGLEGLDYSVQSGCEVASFGTDVFLGAGVSFTPNNGNFSVSPSLETALTLNNNGGVNRKVYPKIQVTQQIGKNTKILAEAKPFVHEKFRIGVSFNF